MICMPHKIRSLILSDGKMKRIIIVRFEFEKGSVLPITVNKEMQLQQSLVMRNWYYTTVIALLYPKYDSITKIASTD